MKNLLRLHEAIAIILLNKENWAASYDAIAKEINIRKLYVRKDNQPLPSYQVMQRSILSKGKFSHLFEEVDKKSIRLRNLNK